jgi:hypothetical protein
LIREHDTQSFNPSYLFAIRAPNPPDDIITVDFGAERADPDWNRNWPRSERLRGTFNIAKTKAVYQIFGGNCSTPPSEELTTPISPNYDRFTIGPWITVLCLWVFAVLPSIFHLGTGGLTFSPELVALIIVIPVATVVGAIRLTVNLSRRRWRAAMSIVLASAAFSIATFSSSKFSDELRWYTLRPYYVAQIERAPGGPYNVHGIPWGGGIGWDITLEYHETVTDARAWQQKQQEWLGSCKRSLKEIAPHYFLNGVYC